MFKLFGNLMLPILYVRLGCHLCDNVRRLLLECHISYTPVNIDDDDALKNQYDWLVPVLYRPDIDKELCYPFNREALLDFIREPQ